MDEGKKKRDSRTTEQPAVRTTIVGARPPGPRKGVGSVPRGIEVLVKKAAVDSEFKVLLLAERSAAAAEIGLELSDAEAIMLDGVPEPQLESIIANTTVSPKLRPAFMGRAAAVMLAALGTTVVTFAEQVENGEDSDDAEGTVITEKTYGARDDNATGNNDVGEQDKPAVTGTTGTRNDLGPGGTGIRPDLPFEGERINLKKLRVNISGPLTIEGPSTSSEGRTEGWIDYVVWQHLTGVRYIYTKAAKINPNMGAGEIIVQFTISADGSVTDATVLNSTMDSSVLESELISRIYGWEFPAIEEGEVTVDYPFEFINTDE